MQINKNLNKLASILLAKSIKDLYPDAILVQSLNNEDGFSYSFKFIDNIGANDFGKIKKQMQKNIDRAYQIKYENIDKASLLQLFSNNKFKLELIAEDKSDVIPVIKFGDEYIDLCENLGIEKLSTIKAIDLVNVSGYYWKASASNDQLLKIDGMAFESTQALEEYKKYLVEKAESDHRKIGKDLELFTFADIVGQGLPIWLPNGEAIKYEIESYIFKVLRLYGFNIVSTPILGSKLLYETSGHWAHYRENMFAPVQIDDETLVLRPMTCPHHMAVYMSSPKSYRDLPYRIGEFAFLHRYEASGGLIGLERVRQLQLIDTHILCTPAQIKSEVKRVYKIIQEIYKVFGTKIYSVDLSLHNPNNKEKFFDNPKMWAHAEKQLRNILNGLKINYNEMIGEAAFYGPKIDFQVKTNLGKIITVSTIQLDFLLPTRFNLKYKDSDGSEKMPILIHLGTIGTLERFVSVLLEQTKGVLPLWLAPNQVDIILVDNNKHAKYAEKIAKALRKQTIRVYIDNSDERLSKKIFNAQTHKVPYQLIIGDNEVNNKTVSYREYGKQESTEIKLNKFISTLKKRIKAKN